MTIWTIVKFHLGGCMEIIELDKLKCAQSFLIKKWLKTKKTSDQSCLVSVSVALAWEVKP